MKKYISREDVPEVLSYLYKVLCEVSKQNVLLHSYHVVFSMGTIVRIDPDEDIDPFEYTPEHMETWPLHRLVEPCAETIYEDLCRVYREQTDSEYCDIVKSAFTKLLRAEDGEPIICCLDKGILETTDATGKKTCISTYMVQFSDYANVIECSNDVEYSNDVECSNDGRDTDMLECIETTISMFELDCMFPQIYAIITPSLEIILCID